MDVSGTRAQEKQEREPASWWDFDVFQIQIASVIVRTVSKFEPLQLNGFAQ